MSTRTKGQKRPSTSWCSRGGVHGRAVWKEGLREGDDGEQEGALPGCTLPFWMVIDTISHREELMGPLLLDIQWTSNTTSSVQQLQREEGVGSKCEGEGNRCKSSCGRYRGRRNLGADGAACSFIKEDYGRRNGKKRVTSPTEYAR